MKLPLSVPDEFRIIAHRGASGYAPENTLVAFCLAEEMGASEIETDVRISKDGELVLCHDSDLARYGYPNLQVESLLLEELLSLDMGSWFSPYLYRGERLMTLDALLGYFSDRFTYHLELKASTEGLGQAVLERLSAHRLSEHAILTSFRFNALAEVRELDQEMKVGWLVKTKGLSTDKITRAAEAGFFQICPGADETNKEDVLEAKSSLPEVRAHRVRGMPDLLQAIEAVCDGVTINWPDWLVHERVVDSRGQDDDGASLDRAAGFN